MKNLKDLVRFNKKVIGATNDELKKKADELEVSIPYKTRISNCQIDDDNARFRSYKNKIQNECERQDLENELTNKECVNTIDKTRNKSKKKIVKKDGRNWSKVLTCILCGIMSSALSIAGMLSVANKVSDSALVMMLTFFVIMFAGIMLNNLVLQPNMFDMYRLRKCVKNYSKIIVYGLIILLGFIISMITNMISINLLLTAFELSKTEKLLMAISYGTIFDIIPLLINSTKNDYNAGDYNQEFLSKFNQKNNQENEQELNKKNELEITGGSKGELQTVDNKTPILLVQNLQPQNEEIFEKELKQKFNPKIEEIEVQNFDKKMDGFLDKNGTDFFDVGSDMEELDKEKNNKKTKDKNKNVRPSLSIYNTQVKFDNAVKKYLSDGARVTPTAIKTKNNGTYRKFRDGSKYVEKVGNKYIAKLA